MTRTFQKPVKRVVVKLGSSQIVDEKFRARRERLSSLARQIALLHKKGVEVVLVSSGAIATGMGELGETRRPTDLGALQARAAVGQAVLMRNYIEAFKKVGFKCAQVLLSWDDFEKETRKQNVRHTLDALLQKDIVPIINENDTTSTEEIKFGDNDKLSALVAKLLHANLLVILSDVDGLLDVDKKVYREVDAITPEILKAVGPTANDHQARGGMKTKIDAVELAREAHIPTVIAGGNVKDVLVKIVSAQPVGTYFLTMSLSAQILKITKAAKQASYKMALVSTKQKNEALMKMARALEARQAYLLRENARDLIAAQKSGDTQATIDRLTLNPKRIKAMADGLRETAKLKDPVGDLLETIRRPNGLLIKKIRVPLGVVGIIYESRPNVTADCAALCLKSGNAAILKGGREAIFSNKAIFKVLKDELKKTKIPLDALQLIESTDRAAVGELLKLHELVDVIVPRGGESLIRFVAENTRIPVIKHYHGVCQVYVSDKADLKMAQKIAFNAKVQKPGVCNAMETLLVDRRVAKQFLPPMIAELQKAGCEVRGDAATRAIVKEGVKKATEVDWHTEYLDLILSVRVVNGLHEAVEHINTYGSHHSDTIVTRDKAQAQKFLDAVDSACVYVNASTRFTDGFEFGFGAEVGISTDKLHVRGPMALEGLTSYKYEIYGTGQIRQ